MKPISHVKPLVCMLIVVFLGGCGGGKNAAIQCGWEQDMATPKAAMHAFIEGVKNNDVRKVCSVTSARDGSNVTINDITDQIGNIRSAWGNITDQTFDFQVTAQPGLDASSEITLSYGCKTVKEQSTRKVKDIATFYATGIGFQKVEQETQETGPVYNDPETFDGGPYLIDWTPEDFINITLE